MTYELEPVKETKGLGKKVANKAYKQAVTNNSTMYTLWLLTYKHKVGLLIAGNAIWATLYLFPFVPVLIGDFISSL